MSEDFASDFVFNFLWDSRRLRFPAFVLALSTASRVARAGLRRVFSRARVSGSRATDERGDPELEGYLLRGEETRTFYCLPSGKFGLLLLLCEDLLVTGSILPFFSPRLDLSALLMLPLSIDCLALRAAIGLFEPFGLALLGGRLPLPLFLRRTTTRTFSVYRAVLGTRSLHIPVIALLVFL